MLVGFAGVGLILRPTIEEQQLWHGLMGLLSGVIAATAYLQVTALGRVGEPEYRIVFRFAVPIALVTLLITVLRSWAWPVAGSAASKIINTTKCACFLTIVTSRNGF